MDKIREQLRAEIRILVFLLAGTVAAVLLGGWLVTRQVLDLASKRIFRSYADSYAQPMVFSGPGLEQSRKLLKELQSFMYGKHIGRLELDVADLNLLLNLDEDQGQAVLIQSITPQALFGVVSLPKHEDGESLYVNGAGELLLSHEAGVFFLKLRYFSRGESPLPPSSLRVLQGFNLLRPLYRNEVVGPEFRRLGSVVREIVLEQGKLVLLR